MEQYFPKCQTTAKITNITVHVFFLGTIVTYSQSILSTIYFSNYSKSVSDLGHMVCGRYSPIQLFPKRQPKHRGLWEQMCCRPYHSYTSCGLDLSNRIIRAAYTVVLITLIPGLEISRIVLQMCSKSFLQSSSC